ncbi:hypothetical protein BC830DRAFT_71689 [Chytriomyces sp. MP71]|nr:hypothetical protein BC830DRAFT_71689 [Chytriomyces sp. MP71]
MNETNSFSRETLVGYWDWKTILISIGVSFTGSISAILFNELRGRSDPPLSMFQNLFLLLGSALSLSLRGVFFMHFVGMTASKLIVPSTGQVVPMYFDVSQTVLSAFVCAVVVLWAFHYAQFDPHWNDIVEERLKLAEKIYARKEKKAHPELYKGKGAKARGNQHMLGKFSTRVGNMDESKINKASFKPRPEELGRDMWKDGSQSSPPGSPDMSDAMSPKLSPLNTVNLRGQDTVKTITGETNPLMQIRQSVITRKPETKLSLQIMILFDRPTRIIMSGLAVAMSVLAMHHIGISSIRMEADFKFDPGMVILSVIVAIAASIAGMLIIFRVLPYYPYDMVKVVAAMLIAIAVNGMHYSGMGALTYTYKPDPNFNPSGLIDGASLADNILYVEVLLKILCETIIRQDMSNIIRKLKARIRAFQSTGTSENSQPTSAGSQVHSIVSVQPTRQLGVRSKA